MEEIDFELRDYQQDASQNIDKIFETRKYAGATMPTGAGKSFLAIQQILQGGGNKYKDTSIDGVINPNEMFYIAPTNEILVQIKRHIARYVLKLDVNNMEYQDLQKAVTKAFPRLSFMCYQTLVSDLKNEKIGDMEPSLVILDEAHRSGAKTWEPAVERFLFNTSKNDELKVLAISATPERDADGRNMLDEWASKFGYSEEEIRNNAHLGVDMTLTQAVNKGIVLEPDVIHFDAVLGKSDEYKHLVEMYQKASNGTKLQSDLRKSLDTINNDILKIPDFDKLTEQEQEEKINEQMLVTFAEAVKEGKLNPNGKYIQFIPHRNQDIDIFEFMKKKESIVRNLLGDDFDSTFSYLTSQQNDLTNSINLTEFSNSATNPEVENPKVKVILASDKLNEGVHADGISGSFMGRNISEGNKNNKRAQAIMFLQQVGRCIHGVSKDGNDIRPVIFDIQGNFYKQNRNNPNREEFSEIDLFKLTSTQKEFLKIYNKSLLKLPEKTMITDKVPRMFYIMDVLVKYGFKPNNETITVKTSLESLLKEEPLVHHEKEIIEQLEDEGFYTPKKKYNIGKIFYESKKSFWNGIKFFGNYDFSDLKEYGIIDTETNEGIKELQQYEKKHYIDAETGFIQLGVTSEFVGINIYTGNEIGLDGRDANGDFPGRFDDDGYDIDGYNKNGFNKEGKHRITGTIHDEKGFMENGINILTGKNVDMLGYNIKNIKPEYEQNENGENILVGGWDTKGLWHLVNEKGEFTGPVDKYREVENKAGKIIKIDVHGFYSNKKKNYLNNDAEVDKNGFYKTGECMYPDLDDPKRDRYGYDIDGFDRFGFNRFGIHRDTHIDRFPSDIETNKSKRFRASYSDLAKSVTIRLEEMSADRKKQILNLGRDGKFHYITKDEKEVLRNYSTSNFNKDGVNCITEEITDIYGFTILDFNPGTIKNKFGFTPKEIPKVVAQKKPRELYKKQRDGVERNILGTDKFGRTMKREKHPSLEITAKYINDYMKEGKPLEKVIEEIAISNKMLVDDAKTYLKTCINQAVTLYRICPELSKECRDTVQVFHSCDSEKVEEFMRKCPSLKNYLKADVKKYMEEFENIKKQQQEIKGLTDEKRRQESMERQGRAVKSKMKNITDIPGFDEK